MEFQSYNEELGIASLLFQRLFRNIRIGRTDDKGVETQLVVPCVLGQRSRIMKGLENPNKRGNYKVPMIVINRTGFSRNGDRLNNLHNEVKYELSPGYRFLHLATPVPVDIDYEVSIIAKYPSDIDKIASNFMMFFNSDLYVSCEHPKYEGIKMNNQIIMSDSVSEEHSDEPDSSSDDYTSATFNFTYKTFLFGGTEKAKKRPLQKPETHLSTCISSVIVELKPDEIDKFQEEHPNSCVSAFLEKEVQVEVTSYVDDPELSDEVYDDIPIIDKISFGLYVVPQKHDIKQYIQSVDNGAFGEHEHYDVSGYLSSEEYLSGGPDVTHDGYNAPISSFNEPVSCINDYSDKITWNCTLAPYVDKLYWRIDTSSHYTYPDDMHWEHG